MKCRKCPKCLQYMKKQRRRYAPINFWCQRCQIRAIPNGFSRMVGSFLVFWVNGKSQICSTFRQKKRLIVDSPAVVLDRELPIDVTLDKVKLLLTFS